jgi:hypothetical protein
MEAFFVLTKFYKLPKEEVINDLKRILSLEGVVNDNKLILFETLSLVPLGKAIFFSFFSYEKEKDIFVLMLQYPHQHDAKVICEI